MMRLAIVGAGLSGLTLARLLSPHMEVTLFEKSRGVGGRMATRRAEPFQFDHGAQYFTARAEPFQNFIAPFLASGLIKQWDTTYAQFDGTRRHNTSKNTGDDSAPQPRYVAVPGMTALAKHLADGQRLHLGQRVARLEKIDPPNAWRLFDDNGDSLGIFDWVISTAPAPQTAALLPPDCAFHSDVEAIQMRACFALMLGFERPLPLDFDAAHVTHSDVSWIAVNSTKPGRDNPWTLLVHSSSDYAEAYIDGDRDAVLQHLCKQTSALLGHDVDQAPFKALHGWRYANNAAPLPGEGDRPSCYIDEPLHLAAAGDWCLGGRVEGAFLSAWTLARHLKRRLSGSDL